MKRSTKACKIPMAVKLAVMERDNGECILCHGPGDPVAHFVSRAQLGMGIEENILTLCDRCHKAYDGPYKNRLKVRLREYLMSKYPDWDEGNLYYRKYGD